jgi:hypothetical protein
MGRDLESREDVSTLLSHNVAPDFGNEVLRCPGAKWHHAPAVLVVYGKEMALVPHYEPSLYIKNSSTE